MSSRERGYGRMRAWTQPGEPGSTVHQTGWREVGNDRHPDALLSTSVVYSSTRPSRHPRDPARAKEAFASVRKTPALGHLLRARALGELSERRCTSGLSNVPSTSPSDIRPPTRIRPARRRRLSAESEQAILAARRRCAYGPVRLAGCCPTRPRPTPDTSQIAGSTTLSGASRRAPPAAVVSVRARRHRRLCGAGCAGGRAFARTRDLR